MTPRLLMLPLALCLLTSPAAHAQDDWEEGVSADCGYDSAWAEATVDDVSVGSRDEYQALMYGYAVVYDPDDPTRPVSASFRCEIRVNGVPATSTPPAHGTTLVAAAGLGTFAAANTDDVDLCAVVDLDAGGTYDVCSVNTSEQIPPQEVMDVFDAATDIVFEPVGAALCAITGEDVVLDSPVPFFAGAGSGYLGVSVDDDDPRHDCP